MKGFGKEARPKKKLNHERNKQQFHKILNEAFKCHSSGNISEAKKYYQYLIREGFQNADVFNNYGIILKELGQYKEAVLYFQKSIDLNPTDEKSYSNLSGILKELGKFIEAERYIRKAIKLNPQNPISYSNLGSILIKLGFFKEAYLSINKAIELNPHLADAHLNLGIVLMDFGKLHEAKLSVCKAIKLNPKSHDAHLTLGIILRELGKLKDAKLSIDEALQIKTNSALCYQNLSLLNYAKGNINQAKENIKKANSIDPISLDNKLLLAILSQKVFKINDSLYKENSQLNNEKSIDYPIILYRPIDQKLIKSLYKIKSLDLNKFTDPSFGNARGSDYKLFQKNEKITENLKKDLISITQKIVNSDVFFRDSFFTILGGDSTIEKHNHIGQLDKFPDLNLWRQKYSLVYYLSIGDQECKYPGSLKFYEGEDSITSNAEILPKEGMIVIFPANRYHSVKYNGKKDRIIIGVNFYSI